MHPGQNDIGKKILKSALRLFIETFGVEVVNENLAEIFWEESNALNDLNYDELSEAYDNINKLIRDKRFNRKT